MERMQVLVMNTKEYAEREIKLELSPELTHEENLKVLQGYFSPLNKRVKNFHFIRFKTIITPLKPRKGSKAPVTSAAPDTPKKPREACIVELW